MTNSINTLKEQVAELFNNATDKEEIATLTKINETINSVESDYTKLDSDLREILNDYKEVIKHTSFKPTSTNVDVRSTVEAPKIEDFLKTK